MSAAQSTHRSGGETPPPQLPPPQLRVIWPDEDDWSDEPTIAESESRSDSATDEYRISNPVLKSDSGSAGDSPSRAWTLRECLEADFSRNQQRRASWQDYRTLVKKWEAAWGGGGPDMRSVTPAQLQQGFDSIKEWTSYRSWEKNRDQLFALLKSSCRQTQRNPLGVPKPEVAPLSEDDLPVWSLPPKEWFRGRAKPAKRHPGHRPCSLQLLSQEEFDRVLTAASAEHDPLYWRTLLGWCWFTAMRIRQTLHELTWRETSEGDGVDLANRLLHTQESKCGGALDVPLPDWLLAGLSALKARRLTQKELFPGASMPKPAQDAQERCVFWRRPNWKNLDRWFYPTWDAIWERAGVPVRMPHQMRGVAISWWIAGKDEKYRKLITGHSLGNDVQMKVYATFGADFRRAADEHPRPSVSLV